MKKQLFIKYEASKKTAKKLKAAIDWQIEKTNEFSLLVQRSKKEKDKFLAKSQEIKIAFVWPIHLKI